jgi:hypothetical protein
MKNLNIGGGENTTANDYLMSGGAGKKNFSEAANTFVTGVDTGA